MVEISEAIIISIVTLLTVMNPPLQIPISGSLIKKAGKGDCIIRAVVSAAIILILFACLGIPLLKYIGISIDSFSVAGGVLLFIIGTQIMTTGETPIKEQVGCIVPIGTPFIAGPGAITVTMLMSKNDPLAVSFFPLVTIAAILFCLFVTMVILYYSDKLLELFGSEGNKAIARIMGIIIAAIGVEFIMSGMLSIIGV